MMTSDSLLRSRVLQAASEFAPLTESFTNATIAARFKSIADRHPERMAVVDRASRLTYEQLDRESNRLAEVIRKCCGTSPRPVALLLPQGAPAVIAILGILKARMFYVPLDCDAQQDWLSAVLNDVQPAVILTDENNLALARLVSPAGVAVLDARAGGSRTSALESPLRNGLPDDVAYIFFTSGTTGDPKGVFDTHRNVLHNILRYTNALAIQPDDRMSLLQSPAFSGSVSSLFCALLNGACAFPIDLRRESMATLADWIREQAVTIYHSVPAIFRSMAFDNQDFPSVRVVRLEGDQGLKADLERFRLHFPDGSVIVNGLGTTETGLVCQFFMDRDSLLTSETLPVGYPSTGMKVRVLDEAGKELPFGHIGEIAVTSRYLAGGYWGRPDLTSAAFQATSAGTGVRTYRTGDLGRVAEDGLLEHLGRLDSRYRFRGQWIVPALIEEALAACSGVDEAVVVLGGNPGNQRLVAYLKCEGGRQPGVDELRRELAGRLPSQSVPARFIGVRELPVTANGKIDRSALPKPDRRRPKLSTVYAAAHSVLHQQLVDLWSDVLELDRVGIRDDFFDLGGDSLLALQMLSRLEILIRHHVPPDILLKKATIEDLAEVLIQNEDFDAPPEVLNAGSEREPLFFLHGDYISGGFYTRELVRHLGSERPIVLLRPCGLSGEPISPSYREMAEIHLEQIRAIQPHGPYLLGGTCNGGLIAFEISQLLTQQGETVARLVMIDASASNLRYRWLRENFASRALFAVSPTLAESVFLYVRWQLEWMNQQRGNRRLKLILKRLMRKIAPHIDNRSPGADSSATVPESGSIAGYRPEVREKYQRLDRLYFPEAYEAPVALLWPKDRRNESLSDVRSCWARICPQIEIDEIPGDGITCLTRHVDTLAQTIEAALTGKHAAQAD
jgi:amino acid adenylation domain-containing protein